MPIVWEPMLLIPLIVLVIPAGILIGQRWRGGPLVSLSAGATLGIVIYLALLWTSLWSSPTDFLFGYPEAIPEVLGSAVLLLGAWALSLTDAMRIRQRALAVRVTLALWHGGVRVIHRSTGLPLVPRPILRGFARRSSLRAA